MYVQKKRRNRTLEVDSVSQMYLPGCFFTLGLLQSLIASVTFSLRDNFAVSFNVQARRLATPPHMTIRSRSMHVQLIMHGACALLKHLSFLWIVLLSITSIRSCLKRNTLIWRAFTPAHTESWKVTTCKATPLPHG